MSNIVEINSVISKDYKSNTYVVLNDKFAVIFDTGCELEEVKKVVGDRQVLGVFITHAHFDHIFNVNKYLDEFKTKLYISKLGYEKLFDNEKNLSEMFKPKNFKIDEIKEKVIVNDEDEIVFDNIEIKVLETIGHSNCSMTYFVCGKWIISGDVIFDGGYGRYDFYDGSFRALRLSIKKILNLKVKSIFPGHGEPFNLK